MSGVKFRGVQVTQHHGAGQAPRDPLPALCPGAGDGGALGSAGQWDGEVGVKPGPASPRRAGSSPTASPSAGGWLGAVWCLTGGCRSLGHWDLSLPSRCAMGAPQPRLGHCTGPCEPCHWGNSSPFWSRACLGGTLQLPKHPQLPPSLLVQSTGVFSCWLDLRLLGAEKGTQRGVAGGHPAPGGDPAPGAACSWGGWALLHQ